MYTSTLPCHMRRLWHPGPDPQACHHTAYTSQHLIQYRARTGGGPRARPVSHSSCPALCACVWVSCPLHAMSHTANKVNFHCWIKKTVKEWGLYVQRKPQAISSSGTSKKLSWFLDLPTYKQACFDKLALQIECFHHFNSPCIVTLEVKGEYCVI